MHKFWKHAKCKDVFFSVRTVAFDENGKDAILHGTWCTQTPTRWFFIEDDRLMIRPEEYSNWKCYEPKGKIKL